MDAVPLCEPWPVSGCAVDLSSYDPVVSGVGVMAASEILWAATGYRYGSCEVTVRPCSRHCTPQPYGGWWWYPERWSGGWPYGPINGGFLASSCGSCIQDCSCKSASTLVLPQPARSISEIRIDGVVLPPSGYAFYDHTTLVRVGAEWPFCQDWNAASGVGVFSVKARYGLDLPALAPLAMGELVAEVLKACTGGACRLPSGLVQTVSREGVTKTFVSPEKLRDAKSFGLPLVDKLIDMVNPYRLMSSPRVWDPENMTGYRIDTS